MKVYVCEEPTNEQLNNVDDLINMLSDEANADQECAWVFSFTADCHLIAKDLISMGGFNRTYIDMKVLFKRVLNHNGSKLLLVHNHPNQTSEPSKADIDLTLHITKVANDLSLELLDHIIIGIDKYSSIKSYIKEQTNENKEIKI